MWSWASFTSPVRFPVYDWQDRATWMARMLDFEPLASYVDHALYLRDKILEGRLEGRWLPVDAALLQVALVEPCRDAPPRIVHYFG